MKNTAMILCLFVLTLTACNKRDEYLNQKSQISQVVPTSLSDLQAVLDDNNQMNYNYPSLGLAGTDNFYVPDTKLSSAPAIARNTYLWAKDLFQGAASTDWNTSYLIVEHANIVLDRLKKLSPNSSNQTAYNNVMGQALFFRSIAFYMLAEDFCKPYDSTTASNDLGIVLRLSSDVNQISTRATVKATYDQMISDLKLATTLLPVTPLYQLRPSQPAAFALLAKIYLEVGDYTDALTYSSKSLAQFSTLLDFNSSLINTTNTYHFPPYPGNPEISFFSYEIGPGSNLFYPSNSLSSVDTALYNSYEVNDLRKKYFYTVRSDNSIGFVGGYVGTFYNFCGIATNEVYLIRAESYARAGNINSALADLNTLLAYRYKTGTFTPVNITDPQAVLSKILLERRKELPFTGQLRWEDLRRLNKDPRFAITLTRNYNSGSYVLPPNDPRYVLPIPDNEIQISGLQQNPR